MMIFAFEIVCLLFSSTFSGDVGVLYEVWHTHAALQMLEVQKMGKSQLTTEKVLRSDGKLTLNDVYVNLGLAPKDIFNVEPKLGFYCLYQHRINDTQPPVQDCPNATYVAQAHAEMLIQGGIDYVVIDVTNWPQYNQETDITVVRPTEVLFETWYDMRQKGIQTPQIAVWVCSPSGSDTWKYFVDHIYNDPKYDDLIYKKDGKKKSFFIPFTDTCHDPSTSQLIESNGGRNDISTVNMWALFGKSTFQNDVWGFFSPCVSFSTGQFTTSIVGSSSCSQYETMEGSSIDEISASSSYMLSQTALPFASPGKLRGLTISRLFEKILQEQPPHVFLSSFNEHIGGRQKSVSSCNIGFNMGLPNDPQKDQIWVDTYGSEFSRDFEPTVEGGSRIWEVLTSCISLYKNGETCDQQPNSDCCSQSDKEVFVNIWSLEYGDGEDYLLTNDENEKNVLVNSQGWKEICNPISGPSAFCVDTSMTDGRAGPFMMYNAPGEDHSIPIFRCMFGQKHFFSTDSKCEGQKVEALLGYVSSQRGGETLRSLKRCLGSVPGTHLHALDLNCDTQDTPIFGFVR